MKRNEINYLDMGGKGDRTKMTETPSMRNQKNDQPAPST